MLFVLFVFCLFMFNKYHFHGTCLKNTHPETRISFCRSWYLSNCFLDIFHCWFNVFKLLLLYLLIIISFIILCFSSILCMDFFWFFYIHYVLGVSLFCSCIHVLWIILFYYWVVDNYIHWTVGAYSMIIENNLPINGQRYERRYVCVFWFEYKYK